MPKTAGIILVGNEILSGKIQDANAAYLCRELRALGVEVRRITVIPDEVQLISETVAEFSRDYDVVFTSGGVGPTHDDVTLRAVASAFAMDTVRHPDLEALLRRGFGDRLHERDLRMADVPSGARLEYGSAGAPGAGTGNPASVWPVIVVRNVWVLPGVPSIFRRKFENVRELFRATPIHGRALYSAAGEGSIAAALDEAVAAFPGVDIGSYPHLDAPDYSVKVTLDGRDAARLDEALAWLAARLGDAVVRID
jgi:molybdenum cofactor synthesis domain-containing protein